MQIHRGISLDGIHCEQNFKLSYNAEHKSQYLIAGDNVLCEFTIIFDIDYTKHILHNM